MELPELPNPITGAKVIGPDIEPEVYHRQEPGVTQGDPKFVMSRSQLMSFRSNPNRWREGVEPKDSDSTEWGSWIDCAMLSKAMFEKRYIVTPETCTATKTMTCVKDGDVREGSQIPWNPLSTEAKKWKKEQEHKGLSVLSLSDMAEIKHAETRLVADPLIREFFACSEKQVMVIGTYQDRATKIEVAMKFLIDLVPDKAHAEYGRDLGDLKSCRTARPYPWAKAVDERDYDAQAAMFLDAYNAATGENRVNFRHILIENQKPFQPGRRLLSQNFIDLGRRKYIGALRTYCQCLKTGVWPSWDDENSMEQAVYNGWGEVNPPLYAENRA